MAKKTIFIFLAIVIVGVAVYVAYHSKPKNTSISDLVQTSIADPKNGTYIIEGRETMLVNGTAEQQIDPGSVSKNIIQYFGNQVLGDFNGDGADDVAFLLVSDGGGSGTFYYVAALVSTDGGYKGTNAVFLGDRIAPQTTEFKNGQVIVNFADRKPDEPMTATPSMGISRYFSINEETLVEIR